MSCKIPRSTEHASPRCTMTFRISLSQEPPTAQTQVTSGCRHSYCSVHCASLGAPSTPALTNMFEGVVSRKVPCAQPASCPTFKMPDTTSNHFLPQNNSQQPREPFWPRGRPASTSPTTISTLHWHLLPASFPSFHPPSLPALHQPQVSSRL